MTVQLRKIFPYVSWDAQRRRGDIKSETFVTLSCFVTKKVATEFLVETSWGVEKRFDDLDEALKHFNYMVKSYAALCGWTPESEVA